MTITQNPIIILRKVIAQVRGIEKAEEWRLYIAIAVLCMIMAGLVMIQQVLPEQNSVAIVNGQQHIMLPMEKITITPRKKAKVEQYTKPLPVVSPAPESGEWCYDEVYKEWRYKK